MAKRPSIRLPRQWPEHIKSGVLHAISLASVILSYTRGQAAVRRRFAAKLEQAEAEIALLREELSIKDGRWERSRSRRRPHYAPTQRMRLLQLRAARGWNMEKTARVFLLDMQTLQSWMRRIDEHGERQLIQTVEPVNRYPDFVRNLVRELKRLFPAMGNERMAAGARPGRAVPGEQRPSVAWPAKSAGVRRSPMPTQPLARRRRVVAKYPGHTWHIDLTAVPTRAGFWVPWFPFSLPQRWPFCWWVAVVVDQVSPGAFVGFAVFSKLPSSDQIQSFLDRAIRRTRAST